MFRVTQVTQKVYANPRVARQHITAAYLLCLTTALGLFVVYIFQNFYPDFMYSFSSVSSPIMAGVAALSSFFALRRYWDKIGSRISKIWLCFTLGMLLWFLGELGWGIYTMFLGVEIPFPSIADIFWLSGYLPLFIALLLYVEIFQPAITVKSFLVAGAIVAGMSAVIFSSLMIPVLADAAEYDMITLGVSLAYPALDLFLFLEAILGLSVFTVTKMKGRVSVAWHFMNIAILLNVIGDMVFSYTTLNGTYYDGHPLELFYHFGYMLFALAFYVHQKEL